MDTHTVYNVMVSFASATDDIDLKRSFKIPPRKLRVDEDLIDLLEEVNEAKRLNVFNSCNELPFDVFQFVHKGMVVVISPKLAYDWFTGAAVKGFCGADDDDMVSLPACLKQSILTTVDNYLATIPQA